MCKLVLGENCNAMEKIGHNYFKFFHKQKPVGHVVRVDMFVAKSNKFVKKWWSSIRGKGCLKYIYHDHRWQAKNWLENEFEKVKK